MRLMNAAMTSQKSENAEKRKLSADHRSARREHVCLDAGKCRIKMMISTFRMINTWMRQWFFCFSELIAGIVSRINCRVQLVNG